MSTQILPTGELVLTNEHDLIGAGYDYLLRGPSSNPVNDTGSFGLTGNGEDRNLRFDHCFLIVPESPVGWIPTEDDLKGFFTFRLERESGEVVSEVVRDLVGDPKFTFINMVHYVEGHSPWYNIPAPVSKMPNGKYILTCTVNQQLVSAAPARFYLGVEGADCWMTQPPDHPIALLPFIEGSVTYKDLNPLAPPPKTP